MENNLLENIKETIPDLTKSQAIIAEYILVNYVEVAFLTLDQLAGLVGTSTGSVMRLTFKLGYSGYSEFQKELQELLRFNSYNSKEESHNQNTFSNELLANFVEIKTDNIRNTAGVLTNDTIEKTLELINKANKIYFMVHPQKG